MRRPISALLTDSPYCFVYLRQNVDAYRRCCHRFFRCEFSGKLQDFFFALCAYETMAMLRQLPTHPPARRCHFSFRSGWRGGKAFVFIPARFQALVNIFRIWTCGSMLWYIRFPCLDEKCFLFWRRWVLACPSALLVEETANNGVVGQACPHDDVEIS